MRILPAWDILLVFMYPRGVQVLLLQPELSVPSILLQSHTVCFSLHSAHQLQKYSKAAGDNYFFSASLLASTEAWYRFGAGFKTDHCWYFVRFLPGRLLKVSLRLVRMFPWGLVTSCFWPHPAAVDSCVSVGMLVVAWHPYLCCSSRSVCALTLPALYCYSEFADYCLPQSWATQSGAWQHLPS